MNPTDGEIVAACLAGNHSAYQVLVERYQDRCYWTAYKLLRSETDAADATQDAFVKAFGMLHTFDAERAFYTWLYRIVVNVAIDVLRRRDLRQAISLELVGTLPADVPEARPEAEAERQETRARVRAIVDEMPEPYRSVLVLADVEGHSGKSIAEMIGVPHATLRWRLFQARKIFRDRWEAIDVEPETPKIVESEEEEVYEITSEPAPEDEPENTQEPTGSQ